MTRALDPHLPTGAHALGALPDAERREFEAHLGGCRTCTAELAGLRATTARLGAAVAQPVPGHLRPQVLDAVRFARQLPAVSEISVVSSRRQGFRRAAALVSVACVAAALVAGANALSTSAVTPVVTSPRTRVGDLLAAPDLRLVAGGPRGAVAMSSSRDEMLFLAERLPPLPRDRVYQLWLVDDHGPRSAGTARPDGDVVSLLAGGVNGAGEALLTVEPAGGSPGPTGSPVVSVELH